MLLDDFSIKTVVIASPQLSADAVSATRVDLAWNAVTGANTYRIGYKERSALVWNALITSDLFSTIDNLKPNTAYDFQIKSETLEGSSPYSATTTITTRTELQDWLSTHNYNLDADLLADDDNDQVPLILEYALGMEPTQAAVSASSEIVIDRTTKWLTLTYSKVRRDVDYEVQTSTDLMNWITAEVDQTYAIDDTFVTAAVPLGIETGRFLRLVVSANAATVGN